MDASKAHVAAYAHVDLTCILELCAMTKLSYPDIQKVISYLDNNAYGLAHFL